MNQSIGCTLTTTKIMDNEKLEKFAYLLANINKCDSAIKDAEEIAKMLDSIGDEWTAHFNYSAIHTITASLQKLKQRYYDEFKQLIFEQGQNGWIDASVPPENEDMLVIVKTKNGNIRLAQPKFGWRDVVQYMYLPK